MVATHVAPAVVPHPVTGQPVWFNLCHLPAPGWTEYADGTPIEPGWLCVCWGGGSPGVYRICLANSDVGCSVKQAGLLVLLVPSLLGVMSAKIRD